MLLIVMMSATTTAAAARFPAAAPLTLHKEFTIVFVVR
jgi:hypothetical protein